ncbi:MAG: hypothetical protein HeimC2_45940 [Candidatus Heimdallarchaeota archaeon LC_2]|nr:MAG: hypothetical protein HeimC2_45940 [Candidatus Heimdallarchaeota archaeon LC_2]
MQEKHIIDTFKILTTPVVLILMGIFDQWENLTAWIYLAIHGTYGILWVSKSRMFPDKSWEVDASLFRFMILVTGLTGYWVAPFLLMYYEYQASNWIIALVVSMWGFGVFWHFSSDMQKYISLKLNPDQLFRGGLWAKIRNPNYFGEFLIYLSFSILSGHWLPYVVFGLIITIEWIPNIRKKEKSLSRYEDFNEWKRKSKIFIPYIL